MSLRASMRAFPTLLRVGFAEAVAYRAEMLIWVLATTMPLIMLALWSAVAREAPVGRFGPSQFTSYFLITFIVRQLTGSWAAWQLAWEVRQGTLAMRLLRPIHPIFSYAAENLAAVPMRLIVAVPVALLLLAVEGARSLPSDPWLWGVFVLSLVGGWAITFLANVLVGCLAMYIESSLKVWDVYLALFFVFSGYLLPVELFPHGLRVATDLLPFRYQIGLPVEVMTGAYGRAAALGMLGRQWLYVSGMTAGALLMWRSGLKRFAAYGG